MGKKDPRIDAYLDKVQEFAKPIMRHLREVIHEACPNVEETWKWSFPNFMYKGVILCNMAAFKNHCTFGFWKAAIMQDPDHIMTLHERSSMGHLGKIESLKDLPPDKVIKKYIKVAMKLNDEDIKLPPRAKPTEEQKKELEIPDYFMKELNKNKKAKTVFDKFSYSHKKEYLQWFAEARTEPTRDKRMAQALEWIAEGKGRNWKYENC
jgi:uncharacterized protein YdeI (YjbR/CyaY-like superfamily)